MGFRCGIKVRIIEIPLNAKRKIERHGSEANEVDADESKNERKVLSTLPGHIIHHSPKPRNNISYTNETVMEIKAVELDPNSISREVTVAGYFEDFVPKDTMDMVKSFNLPDSLKLFSFTGKLKELATIPCGKNVGLLMVVGLGKKGDCNYETIRVAYSGAILQSMSMHKENIMLFAPGILDKKREAMELSFIARLTTYRFSKFKKNSGAAKIENTYIYSGNDSRDDIKRGDVIAGGVNFARDLANMPASTGTPSFFVEQAREINGLVIDVLEREDFIRLGMGGLAAVSRGSSEPPKLLVVKYEHSESEPIMLVGKGITFDSGGISIKPSENLANLKFDKSGAAAVIGAIKAIADLQMKINVVGLMPLAENMPDGAAYKPGDIVRHHNGVTSEIISTDAEGRLVLADALSYGIERFHPRAVVDIATLTGAKMIALGHNIGAAMGNSDELMEKVMNAAKSSWEQLWQLPLTQEFKELIRSDVADIKNTGGKPAGAETAGAFLSYFVGDVPWVHLDIHGKAEPLGTTMRNYLPAGASGFGVRLMVELASAFSDRTE